MPEDSLPPVTPVITDPMPDTIPAATVITDTVTESEIVTVTSDSTGVIDAVPNVAIVMVGTDSTAPMPAIASGVGTDSTAPMPAIASGVVMVGTDSTAPMPAIASGVGTDSTAPMPAIASGVGKVPVVHSATSRKDRRATGPAPVEGRDLTRFYCDMCPKSFKRRKDLAEHKLKRCGKVDKDFRCGVCSKEFYSQETLQDHMGKFHYQFKRHICQNVPKAFTHDQSCWHMKKIMRNKSFHLYVYCLIL